VGKRGGIPVGGAVNVKDVAKGSKEEQRSGRGGGEAEASPIYTRQSEANAVEAYTEYFGGACVTGDLSHPTLRIVI